MIYINYSVKVIWYISHLIRADKSSNTKFSYNVQELKEIMVFAEYSDLGSA